jgi:hypothetical protein
MIPSLESRNASDFINNSQYVKKEDLMGGNDRGYTIQDIDVVEFGSASKGDLKRLPQLVLDNKELFTLNVTNTRILINHFGDNMQDWKGRRIALAYDESIQFGGRMVGGIRLRIPKSPESEEVPF